MRNERIRVETNTVARTNCVGFDTGSLALAGLNQRSPG
jgi:hypothetical protein